jgi:hypothetical protein
MSLPQAVQELQIGGTMQEYGIGASGKQVD